MIKRSVSVFILLLLVLLLTLPEFFSAAPAKEGAAGEEKTERMEIGEIASELLIKKEWIYTAEELYEIDLESLMEEMGDLELKRVLTSQQMESLKAYEDFMENYAEHYEGQWGDIEDFKEVKFTLVYLDDDEIPELALVNGTAHADRVYFYTFAEGEVACIGGSGEYGVVAYVEKEGIIFDSYDTMGNVYNNVYRIEGTEAILLQSSSERWIMEEKTGEYIHIYSVDGEEVTEEEFCAADRIWDEYEYKIVEYDGCFLMQGEDVGRNLNQAMANLVFGQADYLKEKVLSESGFTENELLRFEYDDFDRNGKSYEAFAFLGEYEETEDGNYYKGELWFVSASRCVKLEDEKIYSCIDGLMSRGRGQKYIYLVSNEYPTDGVSQVWTVKNGEAVESSISGIGEIREAPDSRWDDLEIWIDASDKTGGTESGAGSGYTCKPYFYGYDWDTDEFERYESKVVNKNRLKSLCGFDLAAEIEAEGYEIVSVLELKNKIVVVNYAMYPEGDESSLIVYDNVMWDCEAGDYWKREERGVTSWRDAGFGGIY